MQQSYSIDSFGNLNQTSPGTLQSNLGFNALNRISNLPCANTVTPFDASGNQRCDTDTNGAVRQYGVDAESRITNVAILGSGTL
jgi:hypothetical protein